MKTNKTHILFVFIKEYKIRKEGRDEDYPEMSYERRRLRNISYCMNSFFGALFYNSKFQHCGILVQIRIVLVLLKEF